MTVLWPLDISPILWHKNAGIHSSDFARIYQG